MKLKPNPKSPVIYTSVLNAARGLLHGQYKIKNPAEVEAILKEPRMGGYQREANRLFHKNLDIAKAMAKPLEKLSVKQHQSLLQEAVKKLDQKKQKLRNADWRKNRSRTRLTETIMSEAAEDFILGQGNH